MRISRLISTAVAANIALYLCAFPAAAADSYQYKTDAFGDPIELKKQYDACVADRKRLEDARDELQSAESELKDVEEDLEDKITRKIVEEPTAEMIDAKKAFDKAKSEIEENWKKLQELDRECNRILKAGAQLKRMQIEYCAEHDRLVNNVVPALKERRERAVNALGEQYFRELGQGLKNPPAVVEANQRLERAKKTATEEFERVEAQLSSETRAGRLTSILDAVGRTDKLSRHDVLAALTKKCDSLKKRMNAATTLKEREIKGLVDSCNSDKARGLIDRLPEEKRAIWNQKVEVARVKLDLVKSYNKQAKTLYRKAREEHRGGNFEAARDLYNSAESLLTQGAAEISCGRHRETLDGNLEKISAKLKQLSEDEAREVFGEGGTAGEKAVQSKEDCDDLKSRYNMTMRNVFEEVKSGGPPNFAAAEELLDRAGHCDWQERGRRALAGNRYKAEERYDKCVESIGNIQQALRASDSRLGLAALQQARECGWVKGQGAEGLGAYFRDLGERKKLLAESKRRQPAGVECEKAEQAFHSAMWGQAPDIAQSILDQNPGCGFSRTYKSSVKWARALNALVNVGVNTYLQGQAIRKARRAAQSRQTAPLQSAAPPPAAGGASPGPSSEEEVNVDMSGLEEALGRMDRALSQAAGGGK